MHIVEPDPRWTERYDELYRTAYAGLPLVLASTHDALALFRNRS